MSRLMPLAALRPILRAAYGPTGVTFLPVDWETLLDDLDKLDATDDDRFGEFLLCERNYLRRVAMRLTRDPSQADDLLQETLLRAWRARASFTVGTNMRGWTTTIMRRLHLSGLRRLRFVGTYDDALERSLVATDDQQVAYELAEVRMGIASLPKDQRVALELVALEGLAYDAAATRLGLPVGTVKSRVARGRQALQDRMEGKVAPARPQPKPERPQAAQPSALSVWRAARRRGEDILIG